ncbi:class I SAM-dependent methyltransferase [Chloroflexota bacterium]
MPKLNLICPYCQAILELGKKSYYCKRCSREYLVYTVDGLDIIDFNSLDGQNCLCNRDGITICSIDLKKQLLRNLPARKQKAEGKLASREHLIRIEVGQGNKVLDLGCGEGRNSLLFTEENEVYGLDICPKRMLLNEENAFDKSYRTLIVSNAISLPFPEASFDIVVCTELIEHVAETRQLVVELKRVLKEGGKLILSTPNLVSLGNRLGMMLGKGLKLSPFGFLKGEGFYPLPPWREGNITEKECSFGSIRYPEQPLHVRFFTFESLRKFLRQSGFEVETEIGIGLPLPRFAPLFSRLFKNWADGILVVAKKWQHEP